MPNTILNPQIIAQMAVRILENELVMASRVYRGYEEEFEKRVNGYEIGDTVQIRKPQQFSVRQTPTAALQDIQEGKLTLQISNQKGIDFSFTSAELTLKIEQMADRILRPAMVRLANQIDADVMALFTSIPNWVGQPLTGADAPINSFQMFARGAERLDQNSCPQDDRSAVLAPDSYWAMAGSTLTQFLPQVNQQSYRQGEIGSIGGVATYMSQNVPTFTNGTAADTAAAAVAGGTGTTTWATVLNTEAVPGTQTLTLSGVTPATGTIPAGTVFTLGSAGTAVKSVNPVTKSVLPFQQMFTVVTGGTASGGAVSITITPPIIPIGTDAAFGTVNQAAADGTLLNIVGDVSGAYRQNLMFHRNAFALAVVPMVKPPGAVDVARESYRGISARLIPYYNGTTDVSAFRLDVLYGVKVIDNRLAVRLSGGSATTGNPSL
jgi:hypothetical protein